MRHPQYEELKRNMAIFEEIALMLEPYGLHTNCPDGGDMCPGESVTFSSINVYRRENSEECINFSHWLYFVYERDGKELPEVITTMSCSGSLDGTFQFNIQHRAGTWWLLAGYSASYDAKDKAPYTSTIWSDLLGQFKLVLDETQKVERKLTREQAFDALRVMAELFNKTNAEVEAAKEES